MPRITITLTESDKKGLIQYAQHEMRDPRAQAALIIINELRRLKYLGGNADFIEDNNNDNEQLSEVDNGE